MSVVLFPPVHVAPGDSAGALGRAWLTALGAIATAEVIAAWTGQSAQIKWPNDIRVKGRKIAGILVERALAPNQSVAMPGSAVAPEPAWGAVIGIGLNANLLREGFPPELASHATSLQIERTGVPVDRSELARDLIRRLDHWYDVSRRGGPETLNATWCQRSEHMGRVVRVVTSSSSVIGRVVDLDVRFGVTLELHPVAGLRDGEPPGQPSSDLAPIEPILGQLSDDHQNRASPRRALEDRLAPLARLPLVDIQAIEPFPENHPPRSEDPD
jgi:BirA family transcriptional regulator, biotin operon repressor / biotin---[acetyl-CoA-carboxylase] ligase